MARSISMMLLAVSIVICLMAAVIWFIHDGASYPVDAPVRDVVYGTNPDERLTPTAPIDTKILPPLDPS